MAEATVNEVVDALRKPAFDLNKFADTMKPVQNAIVSQTDTLRKMVTNQEKQQEQAQEAAKKAAADAALDAANNQNTLSVGLSDVTRQLANGFSILKGGLVGVSQIPSKTIDGFGNLLSSGLSVLKTAAIFGGGIFVAYNFTKGLVDRLTDGGWSKFEAGIADFVKSVDWELLSAQLTDFAAGLPDALNTFMDFLKSPWTYLTLGAAGLGVGVGTAFRSGRALGLGMGTGRAAGQGAFRGGLGRRLVEAGLGEYARGKTFYKDLARLGLRGTGILSAFIPSDLADGTMEGQITKILSDAGIQRPEEADFEGREREFALLMTRYNAAREGVQEEMEKLYAMEMHRMIEREHALQSRLEDGTASAEEKARQERLELLRQENIARDAAAMAQKQAMADAIRKAEENEAMLSRARDEAAAERAAGMINSETSLKDWLDGYVRNNGVTARRTDMPTYEPLEELEYGPVRRGGRRGPRSLSSVVSGDVDMEALYKQAADYLNEPLTTEIHKLSTEIHELTKANSELAQARREALESSRALLESTAGGSTVIIKGGDTVVGGSNTTIKQGDVDISTQNLLGGMSSRFDSQENAYGIPSSVN